MISFRIEDENQCAYGLYARSEQNEGGLGAGSIGDTARESEETHTPWYVEVCRRAHDCYHGADKERWDVAKGNAGERHDKSFKECLVSMIIKHNGRGLPTSKL